MHLRTLFVAGLLAIATLYWLPVVAEAVQADLSWTNSGNAQVRVERRVGPDTAMWEVRGPLLPAGALSFNEAGLLLGERYCYRPVAFNEFGDAAAPWPERCSAGNVPENVGGVILIIRP